MKMYLLLLLLSSVRLFLLMKNNSPGLSQVSQVRGGALSDLSHRGVFYSKGFTCQCSEGHHSVFHSLVYIYIHIYILHIFHQVFNSAISFCVV